MFIKYISYFLELNLMRMWMQRGLFARLLWPLSLVFRFCVWMRRCFYYWGWKSIKRLPVPVVVIGNIFIGGTGKTPLTIWLIKILRKAGFFPGVVSSGYGMSDTHVVVVKITSCVKEVGDEPLLIFERTGGCPITVGRDRVLAAEVLLATYPKVNLIISDDGLQHYALARDIEIVLFDVRGNGNGWLLPAGPLREPMSRHYDFLVYNNNYTSINGDYLRNGAVSMQLFGKRIEQLCDRTKIQLLSELTALSDVAAVAGIGNPQRFFRILYDAGLCFKAICLPDHYDYKQNPFSILTAELILITEKDAIKCREIQAIKNDLRIWVLPVFIRIESTLTKNILEKLREC